MLFLQEQLYNQIVLMGLELSKGLNSTSMWSIMVLFQ